MNVSSRRYKCFFAFKCQWPFLLPHLMNKPSRKVQTLNTCCILEKVQMMILLAPNVSLIKAQRPFLLDLNVSSRKVQMISAPNCRGALSLLRDCTFFEGLSQEKMFQHLYLLWKYIQSLLIHHLYLFGLEWMYLWKSTNAAGSLGSELICLEWRFKHPFPRL